MLQQHWDNIHGTKELAPLVSSPWLTLRNVSQGFICKIQAVVYSVDQSVIGTAMARNRPGKIQRKKSGLIYEGDGLKPNLVKDRNRRHENQKQNIQCLSSKS